MGKRGRGSECLEEGGIYGCPGKGKEGKRGDMVEERLGKGDAGWCGKGKRGKGLTLLEKGKGKEREEMEREEMSKCSGMSQRRGNGDDGVSKGW